MKNKNLGSIKKVIEFCFIKTDYNIWYLEHWLRFLRSINQCLLIQTEIFHQLFPFRLEISMIIGVSRWILSSAINMFGILWRMKLHQLAKMPLMNKRLHIKIWRWKINNPIYNSSMHWSRQLWESWCCGFIEGSMGNLGKVFWRRWES